MTWKRASFSLQGPLNSAKIRLNSLRYIQKNTLMGESFFPTALLSAISIEPQTSRARPEWGARIPPRTPLSPRIKDKSLLQSLQKDISLRMKSPRINVRPPPMRMSIQSTPKFPQSYTIKGRKFHREFSQESKNALSDPNNLPDDIPLLKKIIYELQGQLSNSIEENDYKLAQEIHFVIEKASEKLLFLESQKSDFDTIREDFIRHKDLETIIKLKLEQWNQQYDAFRQATEKKRNEMIQQFNYELEEFDANRPTVPNKAYMKPSPELARNRNLEKQLAMQHKFRSAVQCQSINDINEADEYQKAMKRTYQDYRRQRDKLVKDFEARLRVFDEHAKSTAVVLSQARQKAIEGSLIRMNKLNSEISAKCRENHVKAEDIVDQDSLEERSQILRNYELESTKNTGMAAFTCGSAYTNLRS